jgi:hypothetical protein
MAKKPEPPKDELEHLQDRQQGLLAWHRAPDEATAIEKAAMEYKVPAARCEILTMPSVTPLWAALEASADAERTGRMFSWLPPEPLSSEAEEQLAIALQDSDRSCTA